MNKPTQKYLRLATGLLLAGAWLLLACQFPSRLGQAVSYALQKKTPTTSTTRLNTSTPGMAKSTPSPLATDEAAYPTPTQETTEAGAEGATSYPGPATEVISQTTAYPGPGGAIVTPQAGVPYPLPPEGVTQEPSNGGYPGPTVEVSTPIPTTPVGTIAISTFNPNEAASGTVTRTPARTSTPTATRTATRTGTANALTRTAAASKPASLTPSATLGTEPALPAAATTAPAYPGPTTEAPSYPGPTTEAPAYPGPDTQTPSTSPTATLFRPPTPTGTLFFLPRPLTPTGTLMAGPYPPTPTATVNFAYPTQAGATTAPYYTPTPTQTPTPTITPTRIPPPPWVNARIAASDPGKVNLAGGKLQLVEFFAYWSGPSLAMAPTLRNLETALGDRLVFTYLDIDNPLNASFKQKLGFKMEPQFFLLDGQGKILDQWQGYVTMDQFVNAINAAPRP